MFAGGGDWWRSTMMTLATAIALACCSAVLHGLGAVFQSLGAVRTGGLRTLRDPAYLVGTGLDLIGWAAAILALRVLPLVLVQTFVAASLVVTAVLQRVVFGVRLPTRGWVCVAVVVAALAATGVAARPGPALPVGPSLTGAVGAALIGLAAAGWWAWRRRRPVIGAVVSGLAFGLSAVCARALPRLTEAVTDPLGWLLVGFSLVGGLSYLRALEGAGRVGATAVAAMLWVTELLVPSAIGLLVLGDAIRPHWQIPCLVAVFAVVVALVVLNDCRGPTAVTGGPSTVSTIES
jgi:drug/metabolite transporter (DMT)-like permease